VADLEEVYGRRFPEASEGRKDRIWPEIVGYLSRWIDATAPVLDIACDRGYFIRNVKAADRWASDIRDLRADFPEAFHFVQSSGLDLDKVLEHGTFGTIFMSNYLEHLPNPDAVIEQLRVARLLLRPGGRVIVLQPNIRLVGGAYWDFIDHKVALTEKSLVEAAELAGLRTIALLTRFLPYSTKGKLPADPRLVRVYLRVPLAWRLLGKQTLYVGEPAT
jgi:SAM-dependent methyltransferase